MKCRCAVRAYGIQVTLSALVRLKTALVQNEVAASRYQTW